MNTPEELECQENDLATPSQADVAPVTDEKAVFARPTEPEQTSAKLPPSTNVVIRIFKSILSLLLKQWLVIGLGIACALAACFPSQ